VKTKRIKVSGSGGTLRIYPDTPEINVFPRRRESQKSAAACKIKQNLIV
jgi:hypothetical protein